eukprot:m.920525 g.920525  ORF g.920525 m.920525 type:complete len:260 (-) comp23754_c0_seq46:2926-3705(-)
MSLSATLREAKEKSEGGSSAPPADLGGNAELTVEDLLADLGSMDVRKVVQKQRTEVQSAVTNALESVGQSAFSLLKGKIGPSSPSRGGAANAPNAVEHDREGNAADAVSFATKFDEHGGQSHLDALRLLATTADARASALLDLRQGKERVLAIKFTKKLSEILTFDDDDYDDDSDDDGEGDSETNTSDGCAAVAGAAEAMRALARSAASDRVSTQSLLAVRLCWLFKTVVEARGLRADAIPHCSGVRAVRCGAPTEPNF